ncbi:SurA N-terminal domain-containing protein [Candidatus Uhrbacteria bacterium]|nr:SurA N-terminal domain-containing protein [Candidatus Uhrbacteria bacterium]
MPIPSKKLRLLIASASGVVALLGGAAVGSWAVFVKHSDAGFVRSVSEVLPIPAAKIGSRMILYRDFLKSRDTLRTFLSSDAAKEQAIDIPYDAQLERNVLEKLINQAAVEELAEAQKVAVTDEELRAFFADVVTAASTTTPDVGVYLLKNFGWNEEDFRQHVLRPALLEQRLAIAFAGQSQGDPNALAAYLSQRLTEKDVVRYLRF